MPVKNEEKRQSNFFNICSKCKTGYSCCLGTRPPLSRKRRRIITEYLKMHEIPVEDPFVMEEYAYPRENADGHCVFHDRKTRKCLIHPVKPETCVAGPITFDINRKRGKIEWFVKMDKICSLARVVYRDKKLLQEHVAAAREEIMRLVKELGAKELKAILAKEEPETLKICEEDVGKEVLDKLACEKIRHGDSV